MSWLRSFWVVLHKEVREGFRDRRAVVTALFFPLLGPLLLVAMLLLLSQSTRQADEKGVEIHVAGRDHAPNLVAFLEQQARVVPAPADLEDAVRRGDVAVGIVIPPGFGERLRAGRPAPVRLVVDESRQQSRPAMEAAEKLLAAWSSQTAAQRLVVRGIHPAVIEPLAVEKEDLSTPASRAAMLLSAVPFFLVMAVFTGGLPVAIDVTAGERERQSLEPLFTVPVQRSALVAAKIGASGVFSALALVETLVGFGLVPVAVPATRLGFSVHLDPWMLVGTFFLSLPMLVLACALMIVFAARARTFRAAQTSLSLLMLVPSLPGIALGAVATRIPGWTRAIPFFGQQEIVMRMMRGEAASPGAVALATATTLLLAALVTAFAFRVFEQGQPLFDS
jgi:sodium transport system permease protein